MRRFPLLVLPLLFLAACERPKPAATSPPGPGVQSDDEISLPEARQGFQTKLIRKLAAKEPVPQPPKGQLRVVRYDSPAGKLAAYLSPDPKDGKKHPAIVWITGGFSNGIGESAWEKRDPKNDQSASAFREAGIVMMYPSLRGGNDNPGFREGFYGEVDDVLAAADFLAKQDYVDPQRIYLGGHSTGGTLVLLAAASTDRFRAVFSFGPADDVRGYGQEELPFNVNDAREVELRNPARWVRSVRCPTFVLEGSQAPGNSEALQALRRAATGNPLVHCYPVHGVNHFSILAPMTRLVAGKIVRDDGPKTNIDFTGQELDYRRAK